VHHLESAQSTNSSSAGQIRARNRTTDKAFTLKEAVYKARSGLGGEMLEHHDVRLDIGSSTFHAEVPPDRSHMDGVFASTPHRWVGLVVVRARTG